MVVPCAWAKVGASPITLAIARKREILPVIPIHTSQKVKLGWDGSRIGEEIEDHFSDTDYVGCTCTVAQRVDRCTHRRRRQIPEKSPSPGIQECLICP